MKLLPPLRGGAKPLIPEGWAMIPEDSIVRGENNNTLEKPDKCHVSQVTKVNINCDKSQVDSMYPRYGGMRMALPPLWSSSQKPLTPL